MKNYNDSAYLTLLYDRNVLLAQILHLQAQIMDCESKLVQLSLSKRLCLEDENVKALRDEIFGCRIEIKSLRVRINRLRAKTSDV